MPKLKFDIYVFIVVISRKWFEKLSELRRQQSGRLKL